MSFKIKNCKLALLALFFIALFCKLGFWQLDRAHQKENLLASYQERNQTWVTTDQLLTKKDSQFYRVRLQGEFDNQHNLLLDNKIFNGKIGYELYTPFKAVGLKQPVLVDRGFIPIMTTRQQIPPIKVITGSTRVEGMLNYPPRYVAMGKINAYQDIQWPLKIEYINLAEISTLIDQSLFSYVLNISPTDKAAYPIEWQIVTMSPDRHKGYAVQWFAFALTLLILFVALNREKTKK